LRSQCSFERTPHRLNAFLLVAVRSFTDRALVQAHDRLARLLLFRQFCQGVGDRVGDSLDQINFLARPGAT
jgi:hypothetical protein